MERLTERTKLGEVIPRMDLRNNGHRKCVARLAAYEDTGLTPEEIIDGKMLTGWIPVSEQLPDEPKFFLVTFVKHFGGYGIEYCYFECGKWFIVADGDNSENKAWREEMKSVIAWMPLPEPYRPQQESGKE